MGYQDYDDWKLANPYDECEDEFVPVEVEVLIFDLGQNIIYDFKNETPLSTTITVGALLTCDDFERECYVKDEDVDNAVAEYLGNDCEYEILNWDRI